MSRPFFSTSGGLYVKQVGAVLAVAAVVALAVLGLAQVATLGDLELAIALAVTVVAGVVVWRQVGRRHSRVHFSTYGDREAVVDGQRVSRHEEHPAATTQLRGGTGG
ncbi:hypothetical protein [Nocardioides alkalitolerans]|uniref:hypothetical protein n=1 Tax=Nocardioides alkalitolerans TaxID=281714 RepID=UPI00041FE890|nr:hypothetical protein [Nocardioides alkalitolerans]